jgi:hypothetical protein
MRIRPPRHDETAGLAIAGPSVAGGNTPATGLYEAVGMAADLRSERWELAASP